MTTPPSTHNTGPFLRRLGRALGLIFNDDGTVGPLHLESRRGREVVAKSKAKRDRDQR